MGEKSDVAQTETDGLEVLETREWVDSLDYVLSHGGPNRAGRLLQQLALHALMFEEFLVREAASGRLDLPLGPHDRLDLLVRDRQRPAGPGGRRDGTALRPAVPAAPAEGAALMYSLIN